MKHARQEKKSATAPTDKGTSKDSSEPTFTLPLTKPLPALCRLGVRIALTLLQRIPAQSAIRKEGGVASEGTGRTRQVAERVVAGVGLGRVLRDGEFLGALDGVEPFLGQGGGGGGVEGGEFGVFEGVVFVSLGGEIVC